MHVFHILSDEVGDVCQSLLHFRVPWSSQRNVCVIGLVASWMSLFCGRVDGWNPIVTWNNDWKINSAYLNSGIWKIFSLRWMKWVWHFKANNCQDARSSQMQGEYKQITFCTGQGRDKTALPTSLLCVVSVLCTVVGLGALGRSSVWGQCASLCLSEAGSRGGVWTSGSSAEPGRWLGALPFSLRWSSGTWVRRRRWLSVPLWTRPRSLGRWFVLP